MRLSLPRSPKEPALFSLDALNDSVTTLISQSPNSANRTKLGFNPAKDYHEIINYEGACVLFAQKKKELANRFSKAELSIFDTSCTTAKKGLVGIKLSAVDMNTHWPQQQKQRAVLLQSLF